MTKDQVIELEISIPPAPDEVERRVLISEVDSEGYVRFGELALRILNQQCQYASRYIDGRHGTPNMGEGLRFKGDPSDYHTVRIHNEDVTEFVRRVETYKQENRRF